MPIPKISIVTPTLNQGMFIEETILSVIGQGYPNLEYIIIDGGSKDNTVEIIKKYEKHIAYWSSEPDKGQSDAINKGFSHASGDILAWINSDDYYLPGIFNFISSRMDPDRAQLLFGNCMTFNDSSSIRGSISNVMQHHRKYDIMLYDYIVQPSSFWTKKTWELTGGLNRELHYAFDWEFFMKCRKKGVSFDAIDKLLSAYRYHDSHKTGGGGSKRADEILGLYRRYSSEQTAELAKEVMKSYPSIKKLRKKLRFLRSPGIENKIVTLAYSNVFKNSLSTLDGISYMLNFDSMS